MSLALSQPEFDLQHPNACGPLSAPSRSGSWVQNQSSPWASTNLLNSKNILKTWRNIQRSWRQVVGNTSPYFLLGAEPLLPKLIKYLVQPQFSISLRKGMHLQEKHNWIQSSREFSQVLGSPLFTKFPRTFQNSCRELPGLLPTALPTPPINRQTGGGVWLSKGYRARIKEIVKWIQSSATTHFHTIPPLAGQLNWFEGGEIHWGWL